MNPGGRKRNYQRELDAVIGENGRTGRVPLLFLHSCCAPCSSYVFEYLSKYFRITDFFYNPNITDENEYRKRVSEIRRLISEQPHGHPVDFIEGSYEPGAFFAAARGLESCREGGDRCRECFRLRLRKTAETAAAGTKDPETGETVRFDYITTTLTISPLKDADALNEIGEAAASEYGLAWLPSDFKKRGGYQRSIELSREYQLYRQNYCGCVFSRERLRNENQ